jgi:chemotaxis protein methyltransferase WspC
MSAALEKTGPEILGLLAARAGMAAEAFGSAAVSYAVRKRVAASGAASEQDYARRLAAETEEFQGLLEELVVPETWFFRDMQAMRCFARSFGDGASHRERVLRVLCVGCSTGEEVYSLAITLREAGLSPTEFHIVGTDISRRALELARQRTYASRSFRERDEATAAILRRWCEPLEEGWQLGADLQAGVEFRPGNLSQADFLADEPPFDAIFCRNVLIYFHNEARSVAVRRLHELLRPDGLLFSAPAEARIFSEAGFRSFDSECPCAFRRREEANVRRRTDRRLSPRESGAAFAGRKATIGFLATSASPPSQPTHQILHRVLPTDGLSSHSSTSPAEQGSSQSVLDAAERAADEGRLEEADLICGQVLAREPASAAAHYLRGMVRQAQGALGEAQRSLEKALYLDPKHYQALVHMMLLAEQRGDQRAAENYRRRADEVVAEEEA